MINLFIDTNAYLSFYRFTTDDLEELRKLVVAINNREIKLYATRQLRDEIKRNREKIIGESLKKIKELQLPSAFPQLFRNYDEFKILSSTIREYSERLASITGQAQEDAEKCELHADKLIQELLDLATELPVNATTIQAAKKRFDIGNPPGKDASYGDAINWECLLAGHPDAEELHLVTNDTDYISPINPNILGEFLKEEWKTKKHSEVKVYKYLADFFKEKFPDIKLASELEKEIFIRNLIQSGNFLSTHRWIARLSSYTDFSDDQIRALYQAATTNDQVYWIAEDSDVNSFLTRIIDHRDDLFSQGELEAFRKIYKPVQQDDELFDLPF